MSALFPAYAPSLSSPPPPPPPPSAAAKAKAARLHFLVSLVCLSASETLLPPSLALEERVVVLAAGFDIDADEYRCAAIRRLLELDADAFALALLERMSCDGSDAAMYKVVDGLASTRLERLLQKLYRGSNSSETRRILSGLSPQHLLLLLSRTERTSSSPRAASSRTPPPRPCREPSSPTPALGAALVPLEGVIALHKLYAFLLKHAPHPTQRLYDAVRLLDEIMSILRTSTSTDAQ